jgi:uncharacterized protein (DUF2235 family)
VLSPLLAQPHSAGVRWRLHPWHNGCMKNKNLRDLQKQWATKQKESAKPPKSATSKSRADRNQAAIELAKKAAKN